MRAHPEALPLLADWTDGSHAVLAGLSYEGDQAALTTPINEAPGRRLTAEPRTVNHLRTAACESAELGNSLLKTTQGFVPSSAEVSLRYRGQVATVRERCAMYLNPIVRDDAAASVAPAAPPLIVRGRRAAL
jgi:hypothetical protein